MNETLQETPDHNPDGDLGPLPVATVQAPALPATVTASPEADRNRSVGELLHTGFQKASELKLTPEEDAALAAPFTDEQVEIRPHDGLLWIPHIHISRRLSTVLGRGQWAMICRKYWMDGDARMVYADCVMLIRGCLVGESIGAQQYAPNNPKMNYSDAIEGAQSEALRRIAGKRLNCGDQVWDPGYCRQWIARHAGQQGGKWVRKSPQDPSRPAPAVQTPAAKQNAPTSPTARPAATVEATEEQKARWLKILEPCAGGALAYYVDTGALLDTESLDELPLKFVPTGKHQADKTLAAIEAFTRKESIPPNVSGNDDSAEPPGGWQGAKGGNPESDFLEVTGTYSKVYVKEGQSAKGPWKRYSVKIDDVYYSTFSNTIGAELQSREGSAVTLVYREEEKGNTIEEVR